MMTFYNYSIKFSRFQTGFEYRYTKIDYDNRSNHFFVKRHLKSSLLRCKIVVDPVAREKEVSSWGKGRHFS